MQLIFLLFKVSLILTNKILGWSEDLRTFWTSEQYFSFDSSIKEFNHVKETENG